LPERVYVAVEGPIGVGKTTLARMLQPEFGAELLLEVFEENPFLSDFYADRERFAFQTQIFFLLSRYRQQREARRTVQQHSLISDYTFAKDRLFAHLNLDGDELEMYERLHRALAERIVTPGLVLYLRASPQVLMERIATRDRPYERNMSARYIASLAGAYEEFFAGYHDSRLLTVDTDRLDVVRNPADLRSVCERIRAALAGAPGGAAPPRPPAVGRPKALPMQDVVSEAQDLGVTADLPLYQEFLALQRAVGELAGALLREEGSAPPARAKGSPHPSQLLRDALAACQASLDQMASSVGLLSGSGAAATRSGGR
jgi:deoxyguanosine kinase